jgi:translation initiation factor 2 subunit 1
MRNSPSTCATNSFFCSPWKLNSLSILSQIKLVAPPLYVLYVTSLDKEKGIETLEKAINAIKAKITELKGNLVIKAAPRSVTESEDKEFDSMMAELERQNREVDGDDDGSGDDGDGPADE